MIPFPTPHGALVIYSGPSRHLKGKTALAKDSSKGENWVAVQFDDRAIGQGYGWYDFSRASFDMRPYPFETEAKCDHVGYSFDRHGRCCFRCGTFMVDPGD